MSFCKHIAFPILLALAAPSALATSWTWSLSGSKLTGGSGTFTACESSTQTYLTGNYSRPSSGFVQMTSSSCNGCSSSTCAAGTCTSTGAECAAIPTNIYAIELPGVHLIVQPTLTSPTTETQPIYNIVTGSCPASNFTSDFIFSQWSPFNDTSSTSQIGVGVFSWTTSGTATVSAAYNLTSYGSLAVAPFTLPNTGCSGGKIAVNGTAGTDRAGNIYITNQNEFFFQSQANHAVFGVKQVAISSAKQLMGTYAGFVYDASGSNSVTPMINMNVTAAGTSVSGYRMLSDGTSDSAFSRTFSISSINAPVNGFLEGTVSDGTSSGNMACAASIDVAGHNSLFCSGQSPGASATPYNMLLISAGNWAWTSGVNGHNLAGNYGTKGTPAGTNVPGTRYSPSYWKDASGNLWVFGGQGYDSTATNVYLDDLWKWDGTNWTFVWGSTVGNQKSVYGTQNKANASNVAGSRHSACPMIDSSGNLWLFGGWGYDSAGTTAAWLNDLWKWDGTNWTWVSGSTTNQQYGSYGTKGKAASGNHPGARDQGNCWIDSTGNIWLFGGAGFDYATGNDLLNDVWKFNGTNWTWIAGAITKDQSGTYGTQGVAASTNTPGARKLATTWVDASGNLWLFGGMGYDTGSFQGYLSDLWKWDGTNWTWVAGPNTINRSGNYGSQGVTSSSNAPGGRDGAAGWIDSSGNFWLFGGDGYDSGTTVGYLNDLWKWDGTNWTWVAGNNTIGNGGVYGTLGTAAVTNIPGGRMSAGAWIDSVGSLWIFGGYGLDSTGTAGYLGDLWRASSW